MLSRFVLWPAVVAGSLTALGSPGAIAGRAPSPPTALRDWRQASLSLPSSELGPLAAHARTRLLDDLPAAPVSRYRQVLTADGLLLRELRRRASRTLASGAAAQAYYEASEALSRHLRTNPNQYVVDFRDRTRRVEIDPYPALDVQKAFTYALWVYLQAPALVPHTKLLSHAGVEPGKVTLLLNDGCLVALLQLADGSEARFIDPDPLPVGRWIHMALTFHERTGCALFLDAQARALRASPPWSGRGRIRSRPQQILYLGCLDRCLPGDIDDVRVYDRALRPAEIARLHRGEQIRDGLVGHWPLDEVVGGSTPNLVARGQPGRVGERVQVGHPAAPPVRDGHSLGFSGKRDTWAARLSQLQQNIDVAETALLRAISTHEPAGDAPRAASELDALLNRLRRSDAKLIHYVELPAAGRWTAFLLDPRAAPPVREFELGPRAPILAAVARLQATLIQGSDEALSDLAAAHDATELRVAARQVASLLWDPLAPTLGPGGEVWLRLEPALERVPFSALVASGGHELVEDYAFAAVGPVAEAGTGAERRGGAPARPVVLFANPAFNHYPSQRAQAGKEPAASSAVGRQRGPAPAGSGAPLPAGSGEARPDCVLLGSYLQGSAQELRAIAALVRDDGRREVFTYSWGDAYESSLKQAARAAGILHLATHAYQLDPACLPAAPTSAWELVGLRFSGANRLLPDDVEQQDDGFLSAAELARLDLRQCELAVFSGCSTVQAASETGGDALGVASAAWVAGAGASLVSLWDIPDAETAPSMVRLHAALLAGESFAQALRTSQLEALHAAKMRGAPVHPSAWASFALRGL